MCEDGYAALPGYDCVECTAEAVTTSVIIGIIILRVLALVVWIAISAALSHKDGVVVGTEPTATTRASAISLKVSRVGILVARQLRTPIVVLQVLAQYVRITGLALPPQYIAFLQVMGFLTLDMQWLTSPGCLFNINFYGELLISTLVPFGIGALIFAPRLYVRWRSRSDRALDSPKLRRFVDKDINIFMMFLFLIFSGVSLTVFQTFGCDHLRFDGVSGTSYLRADYLLPAMPHR